MASETEKWPVITSHWPLFTVLNMCTNKLFQNKPTSQVAL